MTLIVLSLILQICRVTQKLTIVSCASTLLHYPPTGATCHCIPLWELKNKPQNPNPLLSKWMLKIPSCEFKSRSGKPVKGAVKAALTHPVIIKLIFSHSSGWPETKKARVQHPFLLCSDRTGTPLNSRTFPSNNGHFYLHDISETLLWHWNIKPLRFGFKCCMCYMCLLCCKLSLNREESQAMECCLLAHAKCLLTFTITGI